MMRQQHLTSNTRRPAGTAHAPVAPAAGRVLTSRTSRARTVSRVVRGAQQLQEDPAAAAPEQQQEQQQQPQRCPEPPRPPELLGLGHMLPMMGSLAAGVQFESLMLQWRKQYGPFVEFQIPGNPAVVLVADPEAIKEVYEVRQYPKSPRYLDLLPILGHQSMLLTEGEEWKAQREAFNPGFSSSFLKSALPGFISSSQHLVELLGQKADRQEVVHMHHVAILTTLEIICKVGFGEDVDFLHSDRSTGLFRAFEAIGRHVAFYIDNVPLNWMKKLPWNVAKKEKLQAEYDRQLLPILVKRLNELGIPVSEQEQQRLLASSRSSSSSSSSSSGAGHKASRCPVPGIHAASTSSSSSSSSNGSSGSSGSSSSNGSSGSSGSSSSNGSSGSSSSSSNGSSEAGCPMASSAATEELMQSSKDILSLAVQLSRQRAAAAGGSGVDLEELMAQMKTFFAAGHDTTASLIGWTMNFLMNHPEVEARLKAEILSVMGSDTQPSHQQLSEMRYLNAVLKESLRVRPPVGVFARFAGKGATLAGYNVSEKIILVSPFVQHMDPSAWGADADQFRPERWLDPTGPAQQVSHYSYMPFSRGPRDCIGSRMALLEAKTILAMCYRSFDFSRPPGAPAEQVLMSITAHPKHGVPLLVRRRDTVQQQQQREAEAVQ